MNEKIKLTKNDFTNTKKFIEAGKIESAEFDKGTLVIRTTENSVFKHNICENTVNAKLSDPVAFLAFLDDYFEKNDSLELQIEDSKIVFNGMQFSADARDTSRDDAEPDSCRENIYAGDITKDSFKENFENELPITESNCWINPKMMGTLIVATAGKFHKLSFGKMQKVSLVKNINLNVKEFDSHDSHINFVRAGMILTKNIYNTLMSFDFSKLSIYLPLEGSSLTASFVLDDKDKIDFENVYLPTENHQKKLNNFFGEAPEVSFTFAKKDIAPINNILMKVNGDEDSFINMSIKDGNMKILSSNTEDVFSTIPVKVSGKGTSHLADMSINTKILNYFINNVAGDNITVMLKNYKNNANEDITLGEIDSGDDKYTAEIVND